MEIFFGIEQFFFQWVRFTSTCVLPHLFNSLPAVFSTIFQGSGLREGHNGKTYIRNGTPEYLRAPPLLHSHLPHRFLPQNSK